MYDCLINCLNEEKPKEECPTLPLCSGEITPITFKIKLIYKDLIMQTLFSGCLLDSVFLSSSLCLFVDFAVVVVVVYFNSFIFYVSSGRPFVVNLRLI